MANILINIRKGQVKEAVLTDFGFVTTKVGEDCKTHVVTSDQHNNDAAPEVMASNPAYELASDVFALGKVLRRMMKGMSDTEMFG